jgi:hypothetical protein
MIEVKRTDHVVHVNRGKVDGNRKHGRSEPVLSVRRGKSGKADYGHKIAVRGKDGEIAGYFVYDPAGILPCGAKAIFIAPYGAEVVDAGQ